ncbi:DMT family transporter [Sulfitobacter donghicola]|uniref:Multidrug transporter n=1 Tax=Sulfitobacter donghicola DSW-25 = KCTC 12864 = JCM 14565 TaxID=1300350 RepID=A0A073ISM0_9RHOB|nr:DMT family transporter [Sulfitobacter donghicola]KEJ88397.1 multidrug transporter [Sulfitobacter donghicola DSW-25 = KCTC 12864 = JCM 14565]KIN69738.1 Transmembrane drug/metabolite transporter family protein [Sulfitobacter donghicola DSW-25 = KCTC 12864 = JCM 14565]
MTERTISSQSWGLMALLALLWGASFISIRIALDEIPPLTAMAHRVSWASVVLWAYVLIRRLPLPRGGKVWIGFLGMGLLNNVIPFTLMAWGQLYIPSGLTSIFNATTAIFGVLVAALLLSDEHLSRRKAVGVAIGFAGVVTAIGLESLRNFDITSIAQLAVIAGTISYAFAGVWARKMLSGLAPQLAAAGMLTASTLVLVPVAWIYDGPISLDLQPRTLWAIAYFALGATALAYLLYYRILDLSGSGNLMLVTLMITPIAIILGSVILGETLPSNAYKGFALLALGLIVIDGRLIDRMRRTG